MLAVKMPLNRKKLQLDSLHFLLVFVSGSIVVIVVASAPQMPRFFELVSTSSSSFLCPISSFIIQLIIGNKISCLYHLWRRRRRAWFLDWFWSRWVGVLPQAEPHVPVLRLHLSIFICFFFLWQLLPISETESRSNWARMVR